MHSYAFRRILSASRFVYRTGSISWQSLKNPNQQGGGGQDSRSLFIVMFVMIAVFFGLSYYRQKTNPKTVSPNSPAAQSQPVTQQPAVPAPVPAASAKPPVPGAASAPAVQAALRINDRGRERAL